MNKHEEISELSYLRYATLKDLVVESKVLLGVWIFLSLISLVIGGIVEFGIDAKGGNSEDSVFKSVPDWIWLSIFFALFLWFFRGKEFKFTVPKYGVKGWLFMSIFRGVGQARFLQEPVFVHAADQVFADLSPDSL